MKTYFAQGDMMKLNSDFITHEVGGEHILVSVGKTKFSGLARGNTTAAFIIEQLKADTTKDKIVSNMMEKYDVDKETAERDVGMIIEKLRSIGAISD